MSAPADEPSLHGNVVVLLLGPIDVRCGQVSAAIGGAKLRAVLAQLALASGRVVPTEQLIDGVWGEDPPATAANTLQYHVGVLRKALAATNAPDAIGTRPPGYTLTLPSDLDAFVAARRAGDAAAEAGDGAASAASYAAALACWRGPALADLLSFPFAGARATALEAQRLTCLESWAAAELACGRAEPLVAELEELVAEHPLRERLWEHLMVAMYRTGRQADALATYARARDLLDQELGVEPGPSLRATHLAVLAQDPRLTPRALARPAAGLRAVAPGSTRLRSRLPSEVAWVVTPDGHRVRLAGVDMVIGRQSDCDIVVPDDEVSRQHARVVTLGKAHGVIDLGSTNGTAVNGTRITGVTPLMHGDRIELGAIVLRYEGRVQ